MELTVLLPQRKSLEDLLLGRLILGRQRGRVALIESGVMPQIITEPASASGRADQGAGAFPPIAAIEAVDKAHLVAENLVLRRALLPLPSLQVARSASARAAGAMWRLRSAPRGPRVGSVVEGKLVVCRRLKELGRPFFKMLSPDDGGVRIAGDIPRFDTAD